MANIHLQYLRAVLDAKDIRALDLVQEAFLSSEARPIYRWVRKFVRTYGRLPGPGTVQRYCKCVLDRVKEPPAFYADQVVSLSKLNDAHRHFDRLATLIEQGDGHEVFDFICRVSAEMSRAYTFREGSVVAFSETVGDIIDEYLAMKNRPNEVTGVVTPWKPLDSMTLGWQPGEFVTILGRPHKGKTWIVNFAAEVARAHGHRVLFASMEMTESEIRKRLAAITAEVSHDHLRKGKLSTYDFDKLKARLMKVEGEPGEIIVVDHSVIHEDGQLADLVGMTKPDLVIVDSFYWLDLSGVNTYIRLNEKVRGLCGSLKRLAGDFRIPVIGTSQFNRTMGEEDEDVYLEQSGFSDAIADASDISLALIMPPDLWEQDMLDVKILKYRAGGPGGRFRINFNTTTMDFSFVGFVDNDGNVVAFEAQTDFGY